MDYGPTSALTRVIPDAPRRHRVRLTMVGRYRNEMFRSRDYEFGEIYNNWLIARS